MYRRGPLDGMFDWLENEIHYENMAEEDELLPKRFVVRPSGASTRQTFGYSVAVGVIGLLCLLFSNDPEWRIIGGVIFGLACLGVAVAVWSCFWKCEVDREQIIVKCLFYRKRIPWSEITSAEWKEWSNRRVREYHLILRSGKKKRLELDSTMKNLPKMKRLVIRKALLRPKEVTKKNR